MPAQLGFRDETQSVGSDDIEPATFPAYRQVPGLEALGSERVGQGGVERGAHDGLVGADVENLGGQTTELAQHLQAFAVDRVSTRDSKLADVGVTGAHGGEDGGALGADTAAVAGVVDLGAGETTTVTRLVRCHDDGAARLLRVRDVRLADHAEDAVDDLALRVVQTGVGFRIRGRSGQQVGDGGAQHVALAIADVEQNGVAAELSQHLTAEPARRTAGVLGADDGDRAEARVALLDSSRGRVALGADGRGEGSVLDVATAEQLGLALAVLREDRGADREVRPEAVRVLGRTPGGLDAQCFDGGEVSLLGENSECAHIVPFESLQKQPFGVKRAPSGLVTRRVHLMVSASPSNRFAAQTHLRVPPPHNVRRGRGGLRLFFGGRVLECSE